MHNNNTLFPPCPTHSVLRSFLPSFLLSLFPSFPLSFFPSSTIALFLRSSFPSIPSSSCHSFPTSCPHNLFDRSLHHALIFLPPLPSSVSIPYPAKCPSIVHERFKTASSENKIIINRQASKPQSLRVPRRDSRSVMNFGADDAPKHRFLPAFCCGSHQVTESHLHLPLFRLF